MPKKIWRRLGKILQSGALEDCPSCILIINDNWPAVACIAPAGESMRLHLHNQGPRCADLVNASDFRRPCNRPVCCMLWVGITACHASLCLTKVARRLMRLENWPNSRLRNSLDLSHVRTCLAVCRQSHAGFGPPGSLWLKWMSLALIFSLLRCTGSSYCLCGDGCTTACKSSLGFLG